MNKIYPFDSAIILTDDIYTSFNGNTGSSTQAQRNAAYFIAEERMSAHINTLLLPQIVTGTYLFRATARYLELDYGYVDKVDIVQFLDTKESVYYTISGTANVHASLRDPEYGLLDVHYIHGRCACSHIQAYPYKVRVIYQAGLPTGTANRDNMLVGLTTAAEIILNELIGYGNESSGDIGVQEFRNQEYSEKRVKLGRTAFGTSAKAQFIKHLVKAFVRTRRPSL